MPSPSWKKFLGRTANTGSPKRPTTASNNRRRSNSNDGGDQSSYLSVHQTHLVDLFQQPKPSAAAAGGGFLTVALRKLHAVLPEYLELLGTQPFTHTIASQACSVLDSSVATASPSHSPRNLLPQGGSIQQVQQHLKRSKSKSPQRRSSTNMWVNSKTVGHGPSAPRFPWLKTATLTTRQPSAASTARALESEWDSYYAAPFFLLAAAVSLAQECSCSRALPALFNRVQEELQVLKTSLLAVKDATATARDQVVEWLDALILYCAWQMEWTAFTTRVFSSQQHPQQSVQELRDSMMPTWNAFQHVTITTAVAVKPLLESLQKEMTTWKHLLETLCALEQCKYVLIYVMNLCFAACLYWKSVFFPVTCLFISWLRKLGNCVGLLNNRARKT
jgi:hypothetical protein